MRDLIDPFMTAYAHHPDHDQRDGRRETEALFQRQGFIEDWLQGFESAESVLDCLQEQGVGADLFVRMVEDNVGRIIDSGVAYVQNESGLLIPELRECPGIC